jgi:hypothetical protein
MKVVCETIVQVMNFDQALHVRSARENVLHKSFV